MSKIKIILVPITNPKEWKDSHVIVPSSMVEFVSSNNSEHKLKSRTGTPVSSYGTLYQMVGYNPLALEEDQFLPIDSDQWKLCTKYIQRDDLMNMKKGLAPFGGDKPYKLDWHEATLTPTGYKIFRSVDV